MTLTFRRPVQMAKAPPRGGYRGMRGTATAHLEIEKRERDGSKKILHPNTDITSLPVPGGPAMIGYAVGLTIPGPEKSYTAGRIDVLIQLPCGVTDEEIKAQYERAENLAEERLEAKGTELRAYLFGD